MGSSNDLLVLVLGLVSVVLLWLAGADAPPEPHPTRAGRAPRRRRPMHFVRRSRRGR